VRSTRTEENLMAVDRLTKEAGAERVDGETGDGRISACDAEAIYTSQAGSVHLDHRSVYVTRLRFAQDRDRLSTGRQFTGGRDALDASARDVESNRIKPRRGVRIQNRLAQRARSEIQGVGDDKCGGAGREPNRSQKADCKTFHIRA